MSKYKAVPTVVDNIRFASKREARRYQELRLLEKARQVRNIVRQPRFVLQVPVLAPAALENVNAVGCSNHHRVVCEYVADFRYEEYRRHMCGMMGGWATVVEDAKGVRTPVYKLKKRMFEAQYGIEIREV